MTELCSRNGRLAGRKRPCWGCGRWIATNRFGVLYPHGPRGDRCPSRTPGSAWRTARPNPSYL